ncbi:GNA1162 family protein, partial [Elusimicrobiota bacterium]
MLAVLPLNNHTTDLDGPIAVRYWFDDRITSKKGYQTMSLVEIDKVLEEMGVTDGGQLGITTAQELGKKLRADAVIYGDLLDFSYKTTGFLNVRKVRARFKMVDCITGEKLWESEGLGANSKAALSGAEALKAGMSQLG